MDMQVAALDILTTKGGFTPAAARAIGEAMDLQIARSYDDLTTNQNLDETRVALNSKIDAVRLELNAKIDNLRTELKADIAALEVRIDAKLEKLRSELKADMSALEAKLVRWMFAAMAGQTLLLAGLMRLFMPHGS
jgi:hypothetical protein